jgi:hypothetical protein
MFFRKQKRIEELERDLAHLHNDLKNTQNILKTKQNELEEKQKDLKKILSIPELVLTNPDFKISFEKDTGGVFPAIMLYLLINQGTIVIEATGHCETVEYEDWVTGAGCQSTTVTSSKEEWKEDTPRKEYFQREKEILEIIKYIENKDDSYLENVNKLLSQISPWNINLLRKACITST